MFIYYWSQPVQNILIQRTSMKYVVPKMKGTSNTMQIPTTKLHQYQPAIWYIGLVLIVCSVICIAPVQAAGTKYMAGSPELSAYISGSNEVSPGDTVQLKVIIENKGVNEFKFIQSGVVDSVQTLPADVRKRVRWRRLVMPRPTP